MSGFGNRDISGLRWSLGFIAFVYSQRNSSYPFGFFIDEDAVIRKETPWLLERIEELPLVDPDDLPQIQKDKPQHFFTALEYRVPPEADKFKIKDGRDFFNVGNQFYIASNKKVYSFWHTERGDFPAPIEFVDYSEYYLEENADSAIYNPYLLYEDSRKLCYGLTYACQDQEGISRRVMPPIVYVGYKRALEFEIPYGYVCGVGFYEGDILTVMCVGGFSIFLYRNLNLAFALESINAVEGLIDIPANFVWKFSESGKRFAGLYYERRLIDGYGESPYRGVVLKEYEINISESGVWSLSTLRNEFYIGNKEQVVTKSGPYNYYTSGTLTFTLDYTTTAPIAVYYIGEELNLVNIEVTNTYSVDASRTYISLGTPVFNYTYYSPYKDRVYLPRPPTDGFLNAGTWLFRYHEHWITGNTLDIEFTETSSVTIDIVFGDSRVQITNYEESRIGSSDSLVGTDNYQYWNQVYVMKGAAHYNNADFYTSEMSKEIDGYIGQIRYLNAAMKVVAYVKATHIHQIEYDKEDYYKYDLATNFDGGTGNSDLYDGTYACSLSPTEYGYVSAVDQTSIAFIMNIGGSERTLASGTVINLTDSALQSIVVGDDEKIQNVLDYVFVYDNQTDETQPIDVILPNDAFYASAGVFGSYSCCFDWEETHLATKENPDPVTRTPIWMYQEDSTCSIQSSKASHGVVQGIAADDVNFRFFDSYFSDVSFRLDDPDIYPIRWNKK